MTKFGFNAKSPRPKDASAETESGSMTNARRQVNRTAIGRIFIAVLYPRIVRFWQSSSKPISLIPNHKF
jgi:hypothetical protein